MNVRRETAANMFAQARKLLAGWERSLRNPPVVPGQTDGRGVPVGEDYEVPEGASVLETLGNEETVKLRAELAAIASTLEGLAGT